MGKISNARTLADIEFVIDSGRHPNDASDWHAHEVHCVRNRHRFQGAAYEFIIDVTQLTHVGTPRSAWQAMIVTECWILPGTRQAPRQSKWLKVVRGKPSDMLTWMRRHRTQAVTRLA